MDILHNLNAAVRYMESRLTDELDLTELSRIAGTSLDSFERFFSYMTGMTIREYIRRRRLSCAALELQNTDSRVIDIAVRYGYDSADAFARAFVRQHGITPRQARESGCTLKLYPPVIFRITIEGAKEMNFRLLEIPETVVYGCAEAYDLTRYPTREALRHRMWDADSDNIPARLTSGCWNEAGNHAYDGQWYGVWQDGMYTIAREADAIPAGAAELRRITIPAGKYAAFASERGALAWEEFPKLFGSIDAWLTDSGFTRRGEEIIEVYHLWTDREVRRKNRWYEVWIPVETIEK